MVLIFKLSMTRIISKPIHSGSPNSVVHRELD